MFVALFNNEGDENPVIRRASDAVGAFSRQKLRPGLWWRQVGVIDIKQRQDPPCAGPESVEGAMLSIPEKNEREAQKADIFKLLQYAQKTFLKLLYVDFFYYKDCGVHCCLPHYLFS